MSAGDIPEAVGRFIIDHIGSVAELELLLLVTESAPREWSAQDVARELRVEEPWATRTLDEMVAKGILVSRQAETARYHYAPSSPEQEQTLDALARCYGERRVSIVTLIYSKPADHIRNFAKAFRLREDK